MLSRIYPFIEPPGRGGDSPGFRAGFNLYPGTGLGASIKCRVGLFALDLGKVPYTFQSFGALVLGVKWYLPPVILVTSLVDKVLQSIYHSEL